ncbi:MAG: TauD/TfdA dioxygenase family protein [Flavobacteriaceae bacterium]
MAAPERLRVEWLPGPFGARVGGVDIAGGLSRETLKRLLALLYANRILILSGQDIELAEYAAFGEHWGKALLFHNAARRAGGFPTIIPVSNAPARAHESKDGAAHWHSDSSYEEVPASVTMLHSIETPLTGGATLFADTVAAYVALDGETRAQIDGKDALHRMASAPRLPDETPIDPSVDLNRFPVVTHPLVRPHPVTGERALFVSGTAWRIPGMTDGAARELILRLRRHLARPEFRQSYRAVPGDILIWDNFATVHSATRLAQSDRDGERRLLHRISTKGLPDLITSP